MLNKADLAKALNGIKPASFSGKVARRVSFEGLLSPLAKGGTVADLNFLYASRLRNRFTRKGGPQTIYFGEDEDVGSAETKRVSLMGSFAKKAADPAVVFWAEAVLPNAVLDLTDPAVVAGFRSYRFHSRFQNIGYWLKFSFKFLSHKAIRQRGDLKLAEGNNSGLLPIWFIPSVPCLGRGLKND
jgi:hypothetical protein